jgi:hypothetical protein
MRRLFLAAMTGGALLLSACAAELAAPTADQVSSTTPSPVFRGPSGLEVESEEAARTALEAQRIAAEASAAAAAAAAADAEAQRRADDAATAQAARAAAEAAALAQTAPPAEEECIGYGCSPEQDAAINEGERAANDDYGPGCGYQLCGEQGYLEPDVP